MLFLSKQSRHKPCAMRMLLMFFFYASSSRYIWTIFLWIEQHVKYKYVFHTIPQLGYINIKIYKKSKWLTNNMAIEYMFMHDIGNKKWCWLPVNKKGNKIQEVLCYMILCIPTAMKYDIDKNKVGLDKLKITIGRC